MMTRTRRRGREKCIHNNDNDDGNLKKKTANNVERRTMKNAELNRSKNSSKCIENKSRKYSFSRIFRHALQIFFHQHITLHHRSPFGSQTHS